MAACQFCSFFNLTFLFYAQYSLSGLPNIIAKGLWMISVWGFLNILVHRKLILTLRLFHGLKYTSPNIPIGLFRLAYVHTRHWSIPHLSLSKDSLKQLRCFLLWFPESSGAWNHNLNKHFTFLSIDNMLSLMASLCLFSYLQPHTHGVVWISRWKPSKCSCRSFRGQQTTLLPGVSVCLLFTLLF